MTETKKLLTSKRRIQFSDCDSFGHLNNAAYINYFMNTREEQILEAYNMSLPDLYKTHKAAWVVGETRVVYLFPALYGEFVHISTKIIHSRKSSVTIEGIMQGEHGKLHAIAAVTFAWVDIKTGKPKIHPPDIMEFLENANTGLAEKGISDFENRVKAIKSDKKKSEQKTG